VDRHASRQVSSNVVQSYEDCREFVTRCDFEERCPTLRSGRNRDAGEVNSGPSVDVGAKDDSCSQPPQFPFVLLGAGRSSFVHFAPWWGSGPARRSKLRRRSTIIRRRPEMRSGGLTPPVSGGWAASGPGELPRRRHDAVRPSSHG